MRGISRLILLLLFITQSSVIAEPVKIGITTPLTGTLASGGKDILNGILFAHSELANNQYNLIVEDDKCDPKESVTLAQKLINIDKVKYVTGMACSGALLAAAPLYEKNLVTVIAVATGAKKISDAGDFIFRVWPSDGSGSIVLADFINKRHKKLGILTELTEYAQGLQEGVVSNKGGMEVTIQEYAPGTVDFRSQILKFKKENVDAIFLNPQGDSTLIPMLTQLKQLGVNAKFFAMYYPASENVRRGAGELANNVEFADLPDYDHIGTPEGKKLLEKFKTSNEIHYSPMAVLLGVEAFRAIHMAIQSGKEPRSYLYSTTFTGTFGEWSFDRNGDVKGIPFLMKRIVNGKVELIG